MSIDSDQSKYRGEPVHVREVRRVLTAMCKKVEKRVREEKLANSQIPEYIRFAGLSQVDPNGNSIIPTAFLLAAEEEAKKARAEEEAARAAAAQDQLGEVVKKDESLLTVFDQHPHELLLKLWNVEAGGERGDFLGYALIPNSFMMHPAKGARSFELKTDPQFVRLGKEKLQIKGSIFVKITPTKTTDARISKPDDENAIDPHKLLDIKRGLSRAGKSFRDVDLKVDEKVFDAVQDIVLPCSWRLQIFRATKIAAVDRIERSSPMVEVCWKGAVTKRGEKSFESSFITTGFTSTKQNTLDPNWKDDTSAIFELPPVWTDWDIPGRGECGGVLHGGGWVAKNHIPDEDVGDDKARQFKGSYLTMQAATKNTGLQSSASKWLDVSELDTNKVGTIDENSSGGSGTTRRRERGGPALAIAAVRLQAMCVMYFS